VVESPFSDKEQWTDEVFLQLMRDRREWGNVHCSNIEYHRKNRFLLFLRTKEKQKKEKKKKRKFSAYTKRQTISIDMPGNARER